MIVRIILTIMRNRMGSQRSTRGCRSGSEREKRGNWEIPLPKMSGHVEV